MSSPSRASSCAPEAPWSSRCCCCPYFHQNVIRHSTRGLSIDISHTENNYTIYRILRVMLCLSATMSPVSSPSATAAVVAVLTLFCSINWLRYNLTMWWRFPNCHLSLLIIIIIHTFLSRHKVVTSEAVAAQVRSCHYCPLLWARWNTWVLSLDLKTVSEVLSRTVLGSEFQTAGAEWRKARPAKSVLMEGWASRSVGRPKIPRTVSGLQMATEVGWCFGAPDFAFTFILKM